MIYHPDNTDVEKQSVNLKMDDVIIDTHISS